MSNKSASFRRNGLMGSVKKWPYIFVLPYFIAYFLFGLFPIIYSFAISLTDWDGISEQKYIGIKNYVKLFTSDPFFLESVLNTIEMIVFYIPIVIFFGLVMAVVLSSFKPKSGHALRVANFLPYVTTPIAIGIMFSLLFGWQGGTINNILTSLGIIKEDIYWLGNPVSSKFVLCIMLVWQNLGYYIVMYGAGLGGIDVEVYEAARVDGANTVQKFFRITIPLLRQVTVFLVITSIIGGLQLFDQPYMLFGILSTGLQTAGGPDRLGLTAMWYFYDVGFNTQMQLGKAAAINYSLFMFIALFSFIGAKIVNRKGDEK